MIALVRGVTRFTFARLQFRRLWFSVSGLFLHFVDLKIVCPRSRGPWTRADAGKDSDGIPPPTAIFTRRKRRLCGCLARARQWLPDVPRNSSQQKKDKSVKF